MKEDTYVSPTRVYRPDTRYIRPRTELYPRYVQAPPYSCNDLRRLSADYASQMQMGRPRSQPYGTAGHAAEPCLSPLEQVMGVKRRHSLLPIVITAALLALLAAAVHAYHLFHVPHFLGYGCSRLMLARGWR